MITSKTIELIKKHEGTRLMPYKDTVGKITIGTGRNLTDRGISQQEAEYLLNNDLLIAENDARKLLDNFDEHNEVRQAVMIDLSFNLGLNGLSNFKRFLSAMSKKDYVAAANELKNSAWYTQVKIRGIDNCNLILRGSWL